MRTRPLEQQNWNKNNHSNITDTNNTSKFFSQTIREREREKWNKIRLISKRHCDALRSSKAGVDSKVSLRRISFRNKRGTKEKYYVDDQDYQTLQPAGTLYKKPLWNLTSLYMQHQLSSPPPQLKEKLWKYLKVRKKFKSKVEKF